MSRFPDDLLALAGVFLARAESVGARVATAESCTGGLVAGLLTEIAGSSAVVECGFVTYSNDAKSRMLGVPEVLLARHGAVSEEVAVAMAQGALRRSGAALAVSITGVAGPGGGSDAKPVGLVHFACAATGLPTVSRTERFGDLGRETIREKSVGVALALLSSALAAQADAIPRP